MAECPKAINKKQGGPGTSEKHLLGYHYGPPGGTRTPNQPGLGVGRPIRIRSTTLGNQVAQHPKGHRQSCKVGVLLP
jgi:hypothetical protein